MNDIRFETWRCPSIDFDQTSIQAHQQISKRMSFNSVYTIAETIAVSRGRLTRCRVPRTHMLGSRTRVAAYCGAQYVPR